MEGETDEERATCKSVRRMHYNLAHPSRDALARMLRIGKASQMCIDYVKRWTCPVCARKARPKTPRPARIERAERFGDVVCLDLQFVSDVNDTKHVLLHAVDEATYYHMAVVIKSKDPKHVANKFQKHWLSWAGVPHEIVHDQGGEFQAGFEKMLIRVVCRPDFTGASP